MLIFHLLQKQDEVDVIITWQEHPFRSIRNGQKVASNFPLATKAR